MESLLYFLIYIINKRKDSPAKECLKKVFFFYILLNGTQWDHYGNILPDLHNLCHCV